MKTPPVKTIFSNEEDGIYLRMVTEVIVYWRGSLFDHAKGIQNFYDEALAHVGQALRFYETEAMEGAKAIKPDTLGLLPKWLAQPKKNRGIYMLKLESGAVANEPSDQGFLFLADEEEATRTGMVRLVLPLSAMDGGAAGVLALLDRALAGFEFESGHAGYSVNWDSDGDAEEIGARDMAVLAKTYPGLDVNYFDSTLIAFQNSDRPSIKCVNWLTLVGSAIKQDLGTADDLRAQLAPSCRVHEAPGRLVFQAADVPTLGRPDAANLAGYRSVGALLAPYRLVDHPQIIPDAVRGENATEDWLARFD